MYLFGKDENGWHITEEGKFVYSIDKPALCLSYHPQLEIRATLLKFGRHDLVEKYYHKLILLYNKEGFEEDFAELRYIEIPDDFDVEELNKCLTHTGYVAKVYEKVSGI